MNTRQTLAVVLAALAFVGGAARAQNIVAANAAFDQQMFGAIAQMQQQNQQAQQRLWQQHLQTNGPRLRAQYAQLVAAGQAPFSFEQFAYWDLMTAAGTNVQGAREHQQRMFQGQRQAHQTVMEGHGNYNAAMAQLSARQSAAVANHTNQAIRGVAPYVDPSSGRTAMLPHHLPAGQSFQSGGEVYAQDNGGTYWRRDPNGWVRLNPPAR